MDITQTERYTTVLTAIPAAEDGTRFEAYYEEGHVELRCINTQSDTRVRVSLDQLENMCLFISAVGDAIPITAVPEPEPPVSESPEEEPDQPEEEEGENHG